MHNIHNVNNIILTYRDDQITPSKFDCPPLSSTLTLQTLYYTVLVIRAFPYLWHCLKYGLVVKDWLLVWIVVTVNTFDNEIIQTGLYISIKIL
jgi:hypothetical protein